MRLLVLLWAGAEVLQVLVIGLLVVNQRKLQRRLDEGLYFTAREPRSITEEDQKK